jgi:hypothetical protein
MRLTYRASYVIGVKDDRHTVDRGNRTDVMRAGYRASDGCFLVLVDISASQLRRVCYAHLVADTFACKISGLCRRY